MSYIEKLFERLEDRNRHPQVENQQFLNELLEVANNSYNQHTVEGYLSSILIYHQIIEEYIKVLIKTTVFYTQLRVMPLEFKERVVDNKMMGQLIKELKSTLLDEDTENLINKVNEFNSLRNKIVHDLKNTIESGDIFTEFWDIQFIFNEIERLFEDIKDSYDDGIGDYYKYIDEYKESYLGTNEEDTE